MSLNTAALLGSALFLVACGGNDTANTDESLVLYSSLPHETVATLANAYRENSGVTVHFLLDSDEALVRQMADSNQRPPADLLLVRGVGALAAALDADVLRPARNLTVSSFSDPDGYWHGLAAVPDVIAYNPAVVDAQALAGYAALAGERYAGRMCLRRGRSVRSLSLIASLIDELGEREAELTVRGWRRNAAIATLELEDEALAAIDDGRCDLAIVGLDSLTAYRAEHTGSAIEGHRPLQAWVHPLVAAVARHAGNADLAAAFLSWLGGGQGQRILHSGSGFLAVNSVVDDPAAAASRQAAAVFLYADAAALAARARYR